MCNGHRDRLGARCWHASFESQSYPKLRLPPPSLCLQGVTGPSNDAQFCCPITGVAFNGRYKFFVYKPTGQVVSHGLCLSRDERTSSDMKGMEDKDRGPFSPPWISLTPPSPALLSPLPR